MRLALVFAVVSAAACAAPPLTIELAIQAGSAGTCPETPTGEAKCADVPLACPSMLLVRVVDPQAPEQPLIQSCLPVTADNRKDLCSIASVGISPDALPASLPERTLEVQVAVLPVASLALGSDGLPDCQPYADSLVFASETGVAQSEAGEPPIAGHAYYHPGDAVTVVDLGCNDLDLLNTPACLGTNKTTVNASVVELDDDVPVSAGVADELQVLVGQPAARGSGYELNVGDSTEAEALQRVGETSAWAGEVGIALTDAACIAVLESSNSTTLACAPMPASDTTLDLTGVHISASRLLQIESAVRGGDPAFDPSQGLVIGIVLTESGLPQANVAVSAVNTSATVSYLSADGNSVGPSVTSKSGIFVSTDAPFLTTWTLSLTAPGLSAEGFGGLVLGNVTVVVLQEQQTHG